MKDDSPAEEEMIRVERKKQVQEIIDNQEVWEEFRKELKDSKIVTDVAVIAYLNNNIAQKISTYKTLNRENHIEKQRWSFLGVKSNGHCKQQRSSSLPNLFGRPSMNMERNLKMYRRSSD